VCYVKVACTEYSVPLSVKHLQIHCQRTLPLNIPSVDYSQTHSDTFGNFLERPEYALASYRYLLYGSTCIMMEKTGNDRNITESVAIFRDCRYIKNTDVKIVLVLVGCYEIVYTVKTEHKYCQKLFLPSFCGLDASSFLCTVY
jgi:hypothetical protein